MSRALHIVIASAAVLAFAAPAHAQSQTESRLVTYGDLNVNSAAGADVLIRRIDQASEQICGVNDAPIRVKPTATAHEYETTENGVNDTGTRW
jgi:UrcA family protein